MHNSISTKASRRAVLLNTAAVGIFAATGNLAALASDGATKATNDEKNSTETWLGQADEAFFSQHIDSHFEFWDARGRASATLSAVRGFTGERKSIDVVPAFTLDFVIEESTRNVPSDLCFVAHAKLGTFELFVIPVTSAKGERMLQATFARL